jgi:hypothetical protein
MTLCPYRLHHYVLLFELKTRPKYVLYQYEGLTWRGNAAKCPLAHFKETHDDEHSMHGSHRRHDNTV